MKYTTSRKIVVSKWFLQFLRKVVWCQLGTKLHIVMSAVTFPNLEKELFNTLILRLDQSAKMMKTMKLFYLTNNDLENLH